ncbi:2-C-methyl-D-erythritol 4-phosphate cytidylyltransferase [Xylophilus sp. ASV27]|uniref:2-C-methyl-D-erythritol 4-phosphate cytidylyltransferase n=1 Tax=Xylophilus sp. ASV27 TaxID=2795129 RepID=UPI0018ED8571|nr:2-C-methyl-D-erythritol 4-phosphate cytidylyltransferase [Xylophilus sp. ASV27]
MPLSDPPAPAAVSPRFWALIPCAGVGARAGGEGPKQYRPLAGQALVLHTLEAFSSVSRLAGGLLVVAPDDHFFDGRELPSPQWWVARCGGATRAVSVAHGLEALAGRGAAPQDWVLVHDAARCLVTAAQIDALIDACAADPVGGLLAQPLADTLKIAVADRVETTVERRGKWLAQTPQMFRIGMLSQALERAGAQVTDESSAIEAMGLRPRLVPGSAQNFKVTWPEDFALAEAVLASRRHADTVGRFGGPRGEASLLPAKTHF